MRLDYFILWYYDFVFFEIWDYELLFLEIWDQETRHDNNFISFLFFKMLRFSFYSLGWWDRIPLPRNKHFVTQCSVSMVSSQDLGHREPYYTKLFCKQCWKKLTKCSDCEFKRYNIFSLSMVNFSSLPNMHTFRRGWFLNTATSLYQLYSITHMCKRYFRQHRRPMMP